MATDLPFYECETDDGDSIGVRIGLPFRAPRHERGVHGAECQRLMVDIGEDQSSGYVGFEDELTADKF